MQTEAEDKETYIKTQRDSDCKRGTDMERLQVRGWLQEQSDLWWCEGQIDGFLTSWLLKMAE